MNKYCTNCGKELHEGADICINCGKFVSRVPNNNYKMASEETLSIIGMILGIIGFIIGLIIMLDIDSAKIEFLGEILPVRIIGSLFISMFSLAPSIPGLVLSLLGVNKKKTIYGIIGLILSLLGTLFSLCTIIYIIY